jgi:hypothetical protein
MELLLELFLESFEQPPSRLVLRLEATNDRIHGDQEVLAPLPRGRRP